MKRYPFQWLVILCFVFLPVFVNAGEFMPEQAESIPLNGPVPEGESVAASGEGISAVSADSATEQKALTTSDEAAPAAAIGPDLEKDAEYGGTDEGKGIVDPFEPLNRAIFNINDKVYFYVAKPVAKAYSFFVPEWGRVRIRNVFKNAAMPIRFVNSLLQFKFHAAAKEVGRFIVNTTAGLGGMFDILKDNPDAQPSEEDLGQTLGSYGLANGFYLVLPMLGPSTFRDSIGMAGDWFLDPVSYITPMVPDRVAVRAGYLVNETSLRIGEYEDLKESAIDPYISFRDAYIQYRNKKVKE
jgi:phospholipid-binding lipoprotein MlaA